MDCLAIISSGNYALRLCRILESKGYVFEVVATPCLISKGGCGYCLKFPIEYKDLIISEGAANRVYVSEIYKIIPMFSRNKYEKIY